MSETPMHDDTGSVEPVAEPTPYYTYPGPQQAAPRKGGIGCWLAGLTAIILAAGLVVIGLFLPPFNLGDRLFNENEFTTLSAETNGLRSDDQRFELIYYDAAADDEFGARVNTVALGNFLNGGDDAWATTARAATPPYLALQSAVYHIETDGDAPGAATIVIDLPTSASPDVLDLYGWDAEGNSWTFIPSQPDESGARLMAQTDTAPDAVAVFQATPLDPIVQVTMNLGQTLPGGAAALATIISPAGMQPALPTTPSRTLVGNPTAGFEVGAGYQVMPVIRNFDDPRATDPDTVVAIIGNSALRDEHANQIATFASAGGYDGVFIDYRDLPLDSRDTFSAFISLLADNLHSFDLKLGVIVPPADNMGGTWDTGAYDWRALGMAADHVQIDFGLDPAAFRPASADETSANTVLVEDTLRWAVGEISRYRLIGGLRALSAREAGGTFTAIGYDDALAALGNVQIDVEQTEAGTVEPGSPISLSLDGFDVVPGLDTLSQTAFIEYDTGSGPATMWLSTAESLRYRMDRIASFGLAGVGFRDLLANGVADGALDAVLAFKTREPDLPALSELALNWRIEGADGVITEFTTGFGEDVVVTLAAPDGNYAVNVDVVGGEASSSRGGAAVALFAPTPTPTPLPTSTPTPTPTATPTLAPVVPTSAPAAPAAPPSGGPAAPPPAGSIGNFEYGGHVTSAGSGRAVNAMRNAGMTWMKVQIRYSSGGGTGAAAEQIAAARANGFKILLGVVGSPAELAAGGGGYIQQFAAWTGEVAALGPDAIEVWNEPNIWREWPEGQISGANYTALLASAYQAIKSRNGSVMVISAALAPTGAEGAFPGRVVNDDNFLRQMMDAGAMQYMDCLGMHYNEGIVGPRQTSGDPRGDNYYTRYLPSMINVYANISGAQKPICITELGYLTSDGYGPLPEFFNWAANVTLQQHAAWLAEAAAVAAQSGRVRMMIVWNVDFTNYSGTDPMAGYAIIRADGSCPACSTLAGAR